MLGTMVNTISVIVGGVIGLLLKKGVSKRFSDVVMNGLSLCVMYIGISGALKGQNTMVIIFSIVVGAIVGEALDLDKGVKSIGKFIEDKYSTQNQSSIAEGFVTASLLFCVGAMAIVGSLQSGLTGNHEMLFAKSILDGVASMLFSASLGVGVIFSAVFVFLYQGTITMTAQFIAPYLNDIVIAEMTCVGSLLIIGLALNTLNITRLKIMNYIPAIFLPIIIYQFI